MSHEKFFPTIDLLTHVHKHQIYKSFSHIIHQRKETKMKKIRENKSNPKDDHRSRFFLLHGWSSHFLLLDVVLSLVKSSLSFSTLKISNLKLGGINGGKGKKWLEEKSVYEMNEWVCEWMLRERKRCIFIERFGLENIWKYDCGTKK